MTKFGAFVEALAAQASRGDPGQEITGVSCDSRRVRPGHLFVAVPGTQVDGYEFVGDAVGRGAGAVVTEREGWSWPHVGYIRVADARDALAAAASLFHGNPSSRLRVLGITGTNGKTTTAYFAKAILEHAGRCSGLLGTIEYVVGDRTIPARRTTPDAAELQGLLADMVRAECEAAVMEVSSHALEQKRVGSVAFDVGVFTNIARDHLDYHRTPEEYLEAKRRLFEGLGLAGKGACAVINADADGASSMEEAARGHAQVLTYGLGGRADIRAGSLRLDREGVRGRVETPWGSGDLRLSLLGRFNVSNALGALGGCGFLGIDMDTALAALPRVTTVPGRMQAITGREGLTVYVDYAHTADALRNALATLREITEGRVLVVFGCGGDRDRGKREQMGRVAGELADRTVVTSDNPRGEQPEAIIEEIVRGFEREDFVVEPDRRTAIAIAIEEAAPGDSVLVAGKGHETFQEVGNTVIPFDDRAVVRELLGRGAGGSS